MSPLTFWKITCTFAQEVLFNQAFPSVSIGKHTLLNAYRVAGFLHPTPARLSLQKNRPNPCKERTWRACVLFCHPVFPVFIGICIAFIVRGEKNTDSLSQNWNCHNLAFVFEGSNQHWLRDVWRGGIICIRQRHHAKPETESSTHAIALILNALQTFGVLVMHSSVFNILLNR